MHLRCPRSQSLTVQGRASLVLLVFYHASTSYCGVTFTQLLEFLCPLIRNSRALVRCNSINCYNVSSLPWACKMALVRCNSISCYNTHPRKSPLSRGFTVIEFWKTRKSGHFRLDSPVFWKKEITCDTTYRCAAGYTPRVTCDFASPLTQVSLVAIQSAVTNRNKKNLV